MIIYEWKRKAWHIGTGIIGMIVHFATGRDSFFSAKTLFLASILMFSAEFIRLRSPVINKKVLTLLGELMRAKESSQISGMPFYALGVCVTFYLYPEKIALIAISILIFVDPICSIIGKRFGKKKLYNNKTLEGSFAGFIISSIIILGFLTYYQGFNITVLLFSLITASLCTLSELFAIVDDNLSLPILSGASLMIVNSGFKTIYFI